MPKVRAEVVGSQQNLVIIVVVVVFVVGCYYYYYFKSFLLEVSINVAFIVLFEFLFKLV